MGECLHGMQKALTWLEFAGALLRRKTRLSPKSDFAGNSLFGTMFGKNMESFPERLAAPIRKNGHASSP